MALQSTQLVNAITSSQLTFAVVSAPSACPAVGTIAASVGVPCLIGSEIMFIVAQPALNILQVRGRGSDGTAAVAHDVLANLIVSATPGDFPLAAPATMVSIDSAQDYVVDIGQDGVILIGNTNTIYNINKASAAALTLPAPSLAQQGLQVQITSQTAAAHVVTATGLIMDGSSSAPRTTMTFAAFKGATIELVAENGFWNVDSAPQNVTLS